MALDLTAGLDTATGIGAPSAIDPLAALVEGRYVDDLVSVGPSREGGPAAGPGVTVRTPHFEALLHPRRIELSHTLAADRIDDRLTQLLTAELFEPGWVRGAELFERLLTGLVRSAAPDPVDAWASFYRNSLRRAARPIAARHDPEDLGLVRRHARTLLAPGTLLDLGSCFGFWPLDLAGEGRQVTATDICAGTMELLGTVAGRLGRPLDTVTADAAHLPFAEDSFDVVTALHLLEHVDERHGAQVVAEALRVARRQVVIAVPFEDQPDESFGHVRTFTPASLAQLGEQTGCAYDVHERHGGWLTLTLPDPARTGDHACTR